MVTVCELKEKGPQSATDKIKLFCGSFLCHVFHFPFAALRFFVFFFLPWFSINLCVLKAYQMPGRHRDNMQKHCALLCSVFYSDVSVCTSAKEFYFSHALN